MRRLIFWTLLTTSIGGFININVMADEASGSTDVTAILDSLKNGYDKRVRPNIGGPAVSVGISMYILSIPSISEVNMDFTLDMYFRQFWTDPRLAFQPQPGLDKLVLGSEYINSIWVPDTFIVNEKTSHFHKATTNNEFFRISSSGDVLRSIKLTVTASCQMTLQYFPMDRQLCYIEIESFAHSTNDIHYKWINGLSSVQLAPDVSLPHFKVVGHRQKNIEASLTSGNYSRLAIEIQFARSVGYYMLQIYIPSIMIVVMSWVSFWIDRSATTARVILAVASILTLTFLTYSTNAALPKVSYIKSIDFYLGVCLFFVFVSLLEYATVGYMAKQIKMRKSRAANAKKDDPEVPTVSDSGTDDLNKLYGLTPASLDKYSRIIFPITFVIFQFLYWIIYGNTGGDAEGLIYLY